MKPDFEESQFADYFKFEIAARSENPQIIVAPIGQVLEALVGFDFGWYLPSEHPAWGVMGNDPVPGLSRHKWNPSLPADLAVTSHALNFFVQFKRSDYLFRRNARYYAAFGSPYWRFRVDRTDNPRSLPQHDLLEALETQIADLGVVRYVAPACHTYLELEKLADNESLLEECVYVAPRLFKPDHSACVFSGVHDVRVNPHLEPTKAETWADFAANLSTLAERAPALQELIFLTAEAVRAIGAPPGDLLSHPWRVHPDYTGSLAALLDAYAVTAHHLHSLKLDWLVTLSARE